jgi:hypothetical protein
MGDKHDRGFGAKMFSQFFRDQVSIMSFWYKFTGAVSWGKIPSSNKPVVFQG